MTTYLPDTNIWLALALTPHAHHATARRWLDSVGAPRSIAFARATQQSFLRLVTTEAVLRPYGLAPLSNAEAWSAYDALTDDDRVVIASEPVGVEPAWRARSTVTTASPKLWMDAYLATLAVSMGATLVTIDQAFLQWDDVDVRLLGGAGQDAE